MTHELPSLSPAELGRYSRHLLIPQVGLEGQRRLKAARVLLVGAGGLGSPAGLYLAAAGVGRLGLIDADVVDASNLQRQVLYGQRDLGRPKVEAAAERLRDLNPYIEVRQHPDLLTASNALEILAGYDLVVDGSDNFPTRYLVNDACVLLGKPNVYGSIFRFDGQVSVFWAERGPCYRCLFPEPPPPGSVPSCAEAGVLGVLPGIVGSLQANEAIKLILDQGESLVGRLLLVDALDLRFQEFRLAKDPACPICSAQPSQRGLIDYEAFCGLKPVGEAWPEAEAPGASTQPAPSAQAGATVPDPRLPAPVEISPRSLSERLARGEAVVLLDVREPEELRISALPGALLIPLGQLPERLQELDPEAEIVAFCRSGVRSLDALRLLRRRGFAHSSHLAGGINRWAAEVDRGLPRY